MNSTLEQIRFLHATVELCKEEIIDDLVDGNRAPHQLILQDHRIKLRIEKVIESTKDVISLYDDRDHHLRQELSDIKSRSYMNSFYDKLTQIRMNHEQNPFMPIIDDTVQLSSNTDIISSANQTQNKSIMNQNETQNTNISKLVEFSGEEWNGRFVDLHKFYEEYINLKVFAGVCVIQRKVDIEPEELDAKEILAPQATKIIEERVDYQTFVTRVFEFWRIENKRKKKLYFKFYTELLEYLIDFWNRTHAIAPNKAILSRIDSVFNENWKNESIEGWQKPWSTQTKKKYAKSLNEKLQLLANKAKQEKQEKEAAKLLKKKKAKEKREEEKKRSKSEKEEMSDAEDIDIEMKNESNEEQKPMVTTVSVSTSSIPASNIEPVIDEVKMQPMMKTDVEQTFDERFYCFSCCRSFVDTNVLQSHFQSHKHLMKREIAHLEYKIDIFSQLLQTQILDTVEYIEKKQTKTYEEIVREFQEGDEMLYDLEILDDADFEEEDPAIANPLNIPLDFDGKPIPYWLYKFRGLNRYFRCDICAQEYRGPRSFWRHFSEWKHAHQMRRYNLPNTKDFHLITDPKEAIILNEKLVREKITRTWIPDNEEEFEDNEGNVFIKSMYDKLKRQGVV